MADKKVVVATMVLEKECKTCKRFKGVAAADNKVMATVYINNDALESLGNPESIAVSIAVA